MTRSMATSLHCLRWPLAGAALVALFACGTTGQAPAVPAPADALVQVRNAPAAPSATVASRPLCRYPRYPRYPQYVGGDARSAASYRCAVSAP
ncbi:hypothetical protein ASF11_08375 [Acidovorax sp. Leaf76]|uniref:hypothetical protein n=1 Tax=unclassified Acidovorax TaxID=2684926 RepID=UPI0006FFAA6A|nr:MULTISPECIES: hypothetical protein [unclassified Acidovorax]KQO16216.1 hypothetical protein ASF11_08375 [Acidovorax sp. Leaf76]KQO32289.1 hypothetical protein ASF19_07250 [Acidovorax sp. Leaf84]KQS31849.1 hypothetical protein ASG27_07495 [Acidovorax sp. Leaf191]